MNDSDQTIEQILAMKNVAVVGLSSKEDRPSFGVAHYLQEQGYRIIPVNPTEDEVLGETAYATLADIPADIAVDVVDVFRASEQTPEIVEQAIQRGAKAVWLQLGIENDESARLSDEAGLLFVQNHCMKVEHHKRNG